MSTMCPVWLTSADFLHRRTRTTSFLQAVSIVSVASILTFAGAKAQDGGAWIGTWLASPQPLWNGDFPLSTNVPFNLWKQTVRMIARVSLGGDQVRVTLSNEYGSRPLKIGAAAIALSERDATTIPGTERVLTFGRQPTASIPPGGKALSDSVDLDVATLSKVAVSLYLPEQTPLATFHWDGHQTAYIGSGNLVEASTIPTGGTISGRVFLSSVLVSTTEDARAIVAFGDSITDGNGSTPDANSRWPDFLAERLAGRKVAVLNAGFSGARLLQDKMGVNALARFAQDVLSQPGVRSVIILLGINDIGWPGSDFAPTAPQVRAEDMIANYRQLIGQARVHRVRVIGGTITPFAGALDDSPIERYFSSEKESIRQVVNEWIRSSGEFDVVDFDATVRDPLNPERMLAKFDSGDHLHPGDAGYRAMADVVDLQALLGEH